MRRSARCATSSSGALVLLFVGIGCWSAPTSSPADPRKPPPEQPGEKAERTLREDAPLDLTLPAHTPPRRDAATNELLAACRAGHHSSCWLLLQVATRESALEIGLADVVAECEKGDLWSCQAIPPGGPHAQLPPTLPGEWGRMLAASTGELTAEEVGHLRGECRDGFAYSCKALAERSPDLTERREMHEKTLLAARAACRRKVPDACALVAPEWPVEERLAALDWNCVVRRSQCNRYGAALLALGRRDEARNEYERACQYGRREYICLELAELYREGKLVEPVNDRAATIVRIACASLAEIGDAGEYEECAPSP